MSHHAKFSNGDAHGNIFNKYKYYITPNKSVVSNRQPESVSPLDCGKCEVCTPTTKDPTPILRC